MTLAMPPDTVRTCITLIENPVWLDRVGDDLPDGPGIWYPLVKRGTYVQLGMKLGFVTDYFGKRFP